jgi:DNA-binding transcriptional LysR family regulator
MHETHGKDAMINLRALQHAIAVADSGSFVAAARAVHLSQPALSRSVQALERGIGIRLFDRASGAIRTTAAGALFLARARQLMAKAEALELDTHRVRQAGESDVVIGAATYCAEGLVDIAVARLLRKAGKLRIGVVTNHWASLFQSLRRREVELVVADTTTAETDPTLRVERLAHSQGYFAVREGHPLAARHEVVLADVLRFPIATTSRMTSQIMEPLLGATSPGQRAEYFAVACESLSMMKAIAFESDTVAVLPMRAMFSEVRAGDLALLPLRPSWLHGRFGIVSLRNRAHTEVAQRFLGLLKEVDAETEARARQEERRIFGAAAPREKRRRGG